MRPGPERFDLYKRYGVTAINEKKLRFFRVERGINGLLSGAHTHTHTSSIPVSRRMCGVLFCLIAFELSLVQWILK